MEHLEIWKIKKLDFKSKGLIVSNKGNLKNGSWRDFTASNNGNGYLKVAMHNQDTKKTKNMYIHRLVAELFLDTPRGFEHTQVNHKDGDKTNNHFDNLEWVSPKENIAHMHKEGLNKKRREHGKTTTLPDGEIFKAYFMVKIGALGVRESAEKYNMPRTTLSSIVNKRTRRNVTDFVDSCFGL